MLIHHDGRGQVADLVHLRAVVVGHLVPQEQRIALLPFPLGFHRHGVKGQRALARAGDPREYDQLPLGNRQVDVLQIVFGRADDLNIVRHGL